MTSDKPEDVQRPRQLIGSFRLPEFIHRVRLTAVGLSHIFPARQ